MKETKHVILSPEQDLRSILDKYEKDGGWKFKSNMIAVVLTLERETPASPAPPESNQSKLTPEEGYNREMDLRLRAD